MIGSGVKEIQILSQDTTRYGTDLYKKAALFELLEKIDEVEGDFKIKVYYLYPDVVTLTHLKRLKNLKKFIPYFDIPLQHISPNVLKRMGRFYNDKHILSLLDFIRTEFKDSFIHTNFIVGFPGETEADFEMLLEFVKKYRFESISFFEYHDEPLAASSKLDQKVPHKLALARLEKLKKIVNTIYDEKLQERKGRELIGYIM
jgi:ribosomal protein S12 methylthiotransferase